MRIKYTQLSGYYSKILPISIAVYIDSTIWKLRERSHSILGVKMLVYTYVLTGHNINILAIIHEFSDEIICKGTW